MAHRRRMHDRVAAQRLEIKQRYKRRRKRVNLGALRLSELNRLMIARYGQQLPDDDAGRDDLALIVHHMVGTGTGNPVTRIRSWARDRAPWCGIGHLEGLIDDALKHPRRWKADRLAWRLRLTAADRKTLRITTIGAIDANRGERVQLRKQAARDRKAEQRRAKGVIPRHEYEAKAINRAKPWLTLSMSRASWYRAGKPSA